MWSLICPLEVCLSVDYLLYGVRHMGCLRARHWPVKGDVGECCSASYNGHLPSGDGEVYVWDLSSRRCIHKFTDEGCVLGTKVAVSPDGQRVACG